MENYQFIKQIGQGIYGEVWLVKCSRTRRKHVLKRIDLHQVSKREQRAAHLEAQLLSTIKHPNIVTYLDSFHNSFGSLFIVMSYYECGDLYTIIKQQNGIHFEEKQIVHWFVQICLALKYLHDRNILHRNLKTRNIFLTKNNIIKVGDLGLSKILRVDEMSASLIETPYYISPEIFADRHYSEKSDIWALGCCTYEIAVLKHPYVAQDIHSLLQKIMKNKLPPVPEMYSVELNDIISSMLEVNPEYRPSVTQLLLDDYVRRYILLMLQDNSNSPDSQNSRNSFCESVSKQSSSDSSLTIPIDVMNSIHKSGISIRNRGKDSSAASSFTKNKLNCPKSIVITVPDVNGNGDGNDNSQHRRFITANRKIGKKDKDEVESSSITCLDTNSGLQKCSSKMSSGSKSHSVSKNGLNNSEMSAFANLQRRRGEMSLQLLNNLAYTLYTGRQDDLKDSYSCKESSNSEPALVNSDCSFSFVDNFAKKNSAKRNSTSLNSKKDVSKEGNVCTLPQIKSEAKMKVMPKSNDHTKGLPHVKSQNANGNKLGKIKSKVNTENQFLKI